MGRGLVFDIKEFAVFDGPGIRTTVFFKGCPLRCAWCHNPEGLSPNRQLMVSYGSCTRCRRCVMACPNQQGTAAETAAEDLPRDCSLCGKCLTQCSLGLRRIAGTEYGAGELADLLLRNAAYLEAAGGGYTFSGGEPLGQGGFLLEMLGRLRGNHRALETSGFCGGELFSAALAELELVMLDLKMIDSGAHRTWTGQDNALILENLERLKGGNTPFIVRIPLIPGVNDTKKNLGETAELLKNSRNLIRVELMPYHKTAGAKYSMVDLEYRPGFDINRGPAPDTAIFEGRGIPCMVL